MERIYRVSTSGNAREKIEFNLLELTGKKLDAIKITVPEELHVKKEGEESRGGGYTSYLTIIPGDVLYKIYERSGIKIKKRTPFSESERLDTYWAGYILAYYQYKTGLTYKYIHEQISIHRIRELYYPLHEASEEKAINVISKLIKKKYVTRLQQRRKLLNISQRKLAIKARVNIRTLQEYEVGTKSINKASALTVYNLSRVLNCNVKDLLELI